MCACACRVARVEAERPNEKQNVPGATAPALKKTHSLSTEVNPGSKGAALSQSLAVINWRIGGRKRAALAEAPGLHRQCKSAPVIGPGAWLAELRTHSRPRAFPWPDRPAFARAR